MTNEENKKLLLSTWLDLGQSLLLSGAEVTRVEDTITRVAKSYGAVKTDVFVITSSIVLTVTFPEDKIYTVSRRIEANSSTNFTKMEDLNALSRECCMRHEPFTLEEFKTRIKSIDDEKAPLVKQMVGSALAAGSLAVFFGGSLLDGTLAAIMGAIVYLITIFISKYVNNSMAINLVASFAICLLICGTDMLSGLITGGEGVFMVDKVAIGVIMLLIPGIAITNAFRDMLTGNTISGALKFIQSVLIAFMIAAGFMVAIKLTGVNAEHIVINDDIYQLIPALISSVGFAFVFNLRLKYVPFAGIGGLIAWGVYLGCENMFGMSPLWCALLAGIASDVMAQVMAVILKTPATSFLITIVIPLIPGSALYYASCFAVTGNSEQTVVYLLVLAKIVIGLALGIGISTTLFYIFKYNKRKTKWFRHSQEVKNENFRAS